MKLERISPTLVNHRRLWLLRGATLVAAYVAALDQDALNHYGFLSGYLDEVRSFLPSIDSPSDLRRRWADAVDDWEATVADPTAPLLQLRALGLTAAHNEALALAALVEEDARFGALYADLHPMPDQPRLTVGLLDDFLPGVHGWTTARTLAQLGLVTLAEPERARASQPVQVPGAVWDACAGIVADTEGIEFYPASAFLPLEELETLVAPKVAKRLRHAPTLLSSGAAGGLILRGMRHSGQLQALGSVARALGRHLLCMTPDREPGGTLTAGTACTAGGHYRLLGALSLLLGALPVAQLELGPGEMHSLDSLAVGNIPVGVVLGQEGALRGRTVDRCVTLHLPPPDVEQRRRRWEQCLDAAVNGNRDVIDAVSTRHHLTVEGVDRAAHLARAYALLDGRQHICTHDVQEACRTLSSQSLDGLAVRLERGGSWQELIVADSTQGELQNLVVRCRRRESVLSRLGAGFRGTTRGVRALFAGPSGTGKTLAARIIASALGLDLYRVDLASVVSKYIGETERNLSRLFARAEEQDVILLLDEGDSLLTGRTEVRTSNDRYANMETNYLLQRLEHYQGIFLVTTNAPGRIDGAFQRRMDVYVEFSVPNAAQRFDIWQLHCPTDHRVAESFLRTAATRCHLNGGQIRNAVLHAAVLAVDAGCPLGQEHLVAGIGREYRKMGAAAPIGGSAPVEQMRQAGNGS